MESKFDLEFRWLGRLDYQSGLELQNELVEARRSGETGDTVLLLEHEPVYTIGRTRNRESLAKGNDLPFPVVETNRGGQATYHGPGQLVGYPILDLTSYGQDLHFYLRLLEEALVTACTERGVIASRVDGLTGVWVGDAKIASIGVGVRHWISMHGFAINVCGDLDPFTTIVPCGLDDVTMTSVERETGAAVSVEAFAEAVQAPLRDILRRAYSPPPAGKTA